MSPLRKTAFAAGALYLLSFVSIPTLFLYNPLRASNYIVGHGSNTGMIVGVILEMIVALAGIGTAVALFPVVKRQNEGAALGFVATRTLEGGAILAGAACVLSLVSLQQAGVGTSALATGHALISMYDRIFLLSQSFIPAVNALLIGTLLYKSRLVPRWLPLLGFTGAALLVAGDGAVISGLAAQHGAVAVASFPIAIWEFSLGVYLVVKGFKPSAITALYNRPVAVDNRPRVAVAAVS
ncbi:MAG TPA: DUF4386 domain-containing protein [Candidatus Dormibacteraeota bacterium]|jgi:hypothetical protein